MFKHLYSLLCLLLVFAFTATPASPIELPRTGQAISYSPGDSGALHIGRAWPAPRFTDNRNGTIRDNLTGLIWSGDANPLAGRYSGGTTVWQQALDEINRLNAESYLGYNDWRLPNINELSSLVHLGEQAQHSWLSSNGFTGVADTYYWSGSSVIRAGSQAWTQNMTEGAAGALPKSGLALVWPVRGVSDLLPSTGQLACFNPAGQEIECTGSGQDGELRSGVPWPASRFSDNGDGTITDTMTGLIWPQNANPAMDATFSFSGDGSMIWPDALECVARLNERAYLGYSDWRLPNRNEIVSLVNYAEVTPGAQLSMAGVDNLQQRYWSSGTSAANPSDAWNVTMDGEVAARNKFDLQSGSSVWPVRSGIAAQSASLMSSGVQAKAAAAQAAAALSITTSSLPAGTVGTAYSQTLTATGGTTPYTWSRKSGTLPSGLTISTAGVISGKPTKTGTGTFTIQVKDKAAKTATRSLSITISAASALTVTTASLPAGSAGSSYSQTMTAANGTAPYTWSISGGSLPAGLSLAAATGIISGIPVASGTNSVTFKVTDAAAKTASKTLSLTINAAPLAVTTTALPSASPSVSYSQTLTATGGKTPYTWSRTSGSLPSGLSLSTAGVISGKPATAGTSNFTVQVKDSAGTASTKSLSITVAAPLVMDTSQPGYAWEGVLYEFQLLATGGTQPYNWALSAGILPAGLTLNPVSGAITGIPTISGWSDFSIQVKDSANTTTTGDFSIYAYPRVEITTNDMYPGYTGIPYKQVMTVANGRAPYTWSLIGGSLAAGLSLNSATGTIAGIPTVASGGTFTIQVKDANGKTASKTYSNMIANFGAISGTVTDQATGSPVAGANVTLKLTGIPSRNPDDRQLACNSIPFALPDYSVVTSNDGAKHVCDTSSSNNTIQLKVRNPFGSMYPFSVTWNGIAALGFGSEYLAQSFRPTRSGALTKASISLPFALASQNSGVVTGQVYALLKSSLGGDRGGYLAKSNPVSTTQMASGALWVDFTFPSPVALVDGQEYFLEINGTYFDTCGYYYLFNMIWDVSNYTGGNIYQRNEGIWSPAGGSLAFRTYIDGALDIDTVPVGTDYFSMYGGSDVRVYSSIIGTFNTAAAGSDGSYGYNGDDLTGSVSINSSLASYYDANGWITAQVWSYSTWSSSLLTDQFDITFNRSYSAVTDDNGDYSFPDLPEGNYTISFDRIAYDSTTASGSLAAGQQLNIQSTMALSAPATIKGTVFCSPGGTVIAGAVITVTDAVGNRLSTVTDALGMFQIDGIVSGAYTVTFSANGVLTQTSSSTLAPGQVQSMKIWLTGAPVTLNIATPVDGSIISTATVTVTGTVTNADTVTITTDTGFSYPAQLLDGAYSATIPTGTGDTRIYVHASNSFTGRWAEKSVFISRSSFTLTNKGDRGNVSLMETSGSFNVKNPDGSDNIQPRQALAFEYIRTHGDNVDFLVYLSSFDYSFPDGAQGLYTGVRNDVQGINQPVFDNTAQFGSSGKLQGVIDLGNITALAAAPHGQKLDQLLTIMGHELNHRFGAFVRYRDPDGSLNTGLLGESGAHWSYLLDSQGSLMYGNGWKNNGDGTFTSTSKQSAFSSLDLYLMGMISKEQVPPMMLVDNPVIDKTQLPHLGDTITGTARTVTIDDIISAEGPRIPDAASSQKQFNIGFVLLTRAGDNATAAVQAIETLRKAWAGRFAELTQGKGSVGNIPAAVEVMVDSPADGATATIPDVTITGTVINTSGAETGVTVNGIAATVSGTSFTVNHVPINEGSNTITITATDANGLTTTTNRTITGQAGNYLRIRPSVESGTAPLGVLFSLESTFDISSAQVNYTGPVAITLTPGASSSEFSTQLPVEGSYVITANAVGPDGQMYSDSVTVTVVNRWQLDNQLSAKWKNMCTALAAGDVATAVTNFNPFTMEIYREQFTSLSASLSTIAAGMGDIILVKVEDDQAEYAMRDTINGIEYIFYLLFVKGDDGLWKIRNF